MMENKTTTKKEVNATKIRVLSTKDVSVAVPEKLASEQSFSTCVRANLQNWRQGTVACKGRAEVAYTNKKPWKQKGTGRARAGSARSPLWRGGGVIFGPQARVRTLKVGKKVKKSVLQTKLFEMLNSSNIMCANWQLDVPKTAMAHRLLKETGLHNKRVAVFLRPDDLVSRLSFINLANVDIYFFDQLNVYDAVRNDCWLVLERDFDHFNTMVAQWT